MFAAPPSRLLPQMATLAALLVSLALPGRIEAQVGSNPPPPEPVDLVYDANSWPHIYASTDAAALYAFGRAQMRDLPVATSLNLALAAGELAAYVGEGSIPAAGGPGFNIQADIRTHLWRIPERALNQVHEIAPATFFSLQAYVAGLNAERLIWLANAASLAHATEPASFDLVTLQRLLSRPITLLDVLANGIRANGDIAMFEAQRLADDPEEDFVQDPIRTASNSWLIGAGASATARPILLADPHLGIDRTTTLRSYFAQIQGGTMDVCGISFPGWPCIAIGFNADVAWAVTTNNPDIVDVYKAPELAGGFFPMNGGQRPILEQAITLDVFDPTNNSVGTHAATLAWAANYDKPILRRGPDLQGQASIWYGHASFTSAPCLWEFFHGMARASSVPQMMQEIDQNAITYSNFLLADRFGNKGYVWAGRVPRRSAPTPGRSWAEVQDGTSGAYQWTEMHDPSELPREFESSLGPNPGTASGSADIWVQCNVLPDLVRTSPTINPADYPEYMVHWTTTPNTHRQFRADELLRSASSLGTNFDLGDSEEISLDQLDLWWRSIKGFAAWVFGRDKSLRARAGVVDLMRSLKTWNQVASVDSVEGAMSITLYTFYADGLEKAGHHGLRIAVPDAIPFPGELTAAGAQNAPHRYEGNIAAMRYALERCGEIYPALVNRHLSTLTSPVTPWTPTPWSGLSSSDTAVGHLKYLDLTPSRNPLEFAIWPVGGSAESLWTLATPSYELPSDGFIENFGLQGNVGPFLSFPVESGSHTMLQVELGVPPVAHYLEAVGPTEIVDDPRRYANAADFAAGNYKVFSCDAASVIATADLVLNLSYQATTDSDSGSGGGSLGGN
jgi:Penicillin amidase